MTGVNPPVSTLFMDIDVESDVFGQLKSLWEKGDYTVIERIKSLRLSLMENVLNQAKTW
jgi:hypothetical protein